MSGVPANTLLEQVERAIGAVLEGGQSYTLPDGRTVTRANLAELRSLRDQLSAETGASDSAAVRIVSMGIGRMD
jgi:hypothetical protein